MGLKVELSLSECAASTRSFEKWVSTALVSISPSADLILFSGHEPNKLILVAKLRQEPINQCSSRTLEIPLDFDEQITSLSCLPIMSAKQTSLGLVDWTAIAVGLSSGYVKFYTEQSNCLISLKFCDEPVLNLKLQTQKSNSNARSQAHFASNVDELLITHRTCAIVVDGIGLYENLRISREDIAKNHSSYEPAYTEINLPTILTCQRWRFDKLPEFRLMDADLLGMRCSSRFDTMKSDSIDPDYVPPKSFSRALAVVGSSPFLTCYREASGTTTHSYTQMIGSLLPFWGKTQSTRIQINDISCSTVAGLSDKGRMATKIVPSPDKRLAVVTDDFGRVMLVDVTNWLVIRMWKGYRNAQCGWVETKRSCEEQNSPYATFLVIYAPKRGLLEVWSVQRGPRVAAFNVGKNCILLYAGYRMLNMRASLSSKGKSMNSLVEQGYSTNCYLLNAATATVFSIELPYTFSLYRYGDLQSRDRLLINELVGLMQQEAEVDRISEALTRITLAESCEQAIQKIAMLLLPVKIVPVMENLIGKIMKNYDNLSGEPICDDDLSIVELCKRLIGICSIFEGQSISTATNISYSDIDNQFIDLCEEHPNELEELASHLGWTSTDVLRYLSLLALERSYDQKTTPNPWPSMGEPLSWAEFIDCFDLKRINMRRRKPNMTDGFTIKMKDYSQNFLSQERVSKTALFMYRSISENFYKIASNSSKISVDYNKVKSYPDHSRLEPSTRLVLLIQFWLSTKLCNHWKMWDFLHYHIGKISDELKVVAMADGSDEALIEAWKRVYFLILESENIYAAIIATAAIRGDTLRTICDNEKREKLSRDADENREDQKTPFLDWECLCVDAERMSLLIQQLEDVFLLRLLLRFSLSHCHLVDTYVYRVPRISVANILRGGPTIVSELVAQWAVQTNVHPKIFTQPYGVSDIGSGHASSDEPIIRSRPIKFRTRSHSANSDDSAKELIHHTMTSFPRSLEAHVLLLNCLWEFCNRWISSASTSEKHQYLNKALDCLSLLESYPFINVKHNSACLAYKTFFQGTFERLVTLIETNSTILSPKCLRSREALSRRELNMGEDCLDDFVEFCNNISDLMLETSPNSTRPTELEEEEESKLRDKLLSLDNWWSTASSADSMGKQNDERNVEGGLIATMQVVLSPTSRGCMKSSIRTDELMDAAISSFGLINIEALVELNRLTTLMILIFRLKLMKVYPLSLIGEKSRQILKLDLQQSPTTGSEIKLRSGQLDDLRQKFARKCIVGIVEKLSDDVSELIDRSEMLGEDTIEKNMEGLKEQSEKSKLDDNLGLVSLQKDNERWDDLSLRQTSDLNLEHNESLALFTNLLTLAHEWALDRDELHLELVFEMYRCNHDRLAAQLSNRIEDKATLAEGLLKISSQRVLILFGLSPQFSNQSERQERVDRWSLFQPNVANWLKGVQQEEIERKLASLIFPEALKPQKSARFNMKQEAFQDDLEDHPGDFGDKVGDLSTMLEQALGLRLFALRAMQHRTKLILETITNYLNGQANRLAYDLLQLLESSLFDTFVVQEEERLSRDLNRDGTR